MLENRLNSVLKLLNKEKSQRKESKTKDKPTNIRHWKEMKRKSVMKHKRALFCSPVAFIYSLWVPSRNASERFTLAIKGRCCAVTGTSPSQIIIRSISNTNPVDMLDQTYQLHAWRPPHFLFLEGTNMCSSMAGYCSWSSFI